MWEHDYKLCLGKDEGGNDSRSIPKFSRGAEIKHERTQ